MAKLSQFQMFGDYFATPKQRLRGRDFRHLCEPVIDLYERNFSADIRMASAYRISVAIGKERGADHLSEAGICVTVEVVADPEDLFRLSDADKPKQVLKWLHAGCLTAARHFGWPIEPFERAKKAVIAANYANKWVHRHKASRNDRKYRAELHCDLNTKNFRSELVIYDRHKREVARLPDLVEPPDRMIFGWSLGKLKWISKSKIEIRNIRYSGKRTIDASAAIARAERDPQLWGIR